MNKKCERRAELENIISRNLQFVYNPEALNLTVKKKKKKKSQVPFMLIVLKCKIMQG